MVSPVHAKTVFIGVDGFSPATMQRYIEAGALPAMAALAADGVQVPLVSTLPATTPVAWASIVTGAPPSVTGIEGFLVRVPGGRLDERVSGCYSYRNKAQPLWEAAHEAGLRAYVLKFPLSYPSRGAALRVDGAAGWGGLKCFHEIASTSVAATAAGPGQTLIAPADARWANETEDVHWRGTWRLKNLWEREDVVLHVALLRGAAGGAQVAVATRPDFNAVLARLEPRQWSAPLTLTAESRRGPVDCSFRLRVLDGALDPPRLRLFNTPLHERAGHSSPEEVWQILQHAAGPIEEQSEPSLMFHAGLDLDTQLDIFELNIDWLRRSGVELIRHHEWDLLMLHTHILDWAHHLLQGAVDPRHPAYDAAQAPLYEKALRRAYEMVNGLVRDLSAAAGPDANVVVVGDHGQDVQHTEVHLNEWLAGQGMLRWNDGVVDWSNTIAYATGNYIHVGVAARDREGVVPPDELASVRDGIIERLYAMVDPRNGAHPVLIAVPKETLEPLGANGSGAGDVVVCFRSGYEATNAPGGPFTATVPLRGFTSNHDHYWPHDPAIRTRLFARGPSFRTGYVHPRTASVLDVASTVSTALGIAPPAQNQGHPIDALFDLGSNAAVAETLEPMTWAF